MIPDGRRYIDKLTNYEIEALPCVYNFADGHARHTFPYLPQESWQVLPQYLNRQSSQQEVERNFLDAFFDLAHQPSDYLSPTILYCPSASISIEIVANYLRIQQFSVALIEPTFDNLADILKRHGIALAPLSEEHKVHNEMGIEEWLRHVEADAIFLVIPNNPTGHLLSATEFQTLVNYCLRERKLLILDFSFRFFAPDLLEWAQYKLLEETGVSYIAIEDTGKTWPTGELKVSLLLADLRTSQSLIAIYRDIFLCLSPAILFLVNEYIKVSNRLGRDATILTTPRTNRALLRRVLSNTLLQPMGDSSLSVEWMRINASITDLELTQRLKEQGLFVLPGRHFFWSSHTPSSSFIRVALMRDVDVFAEGMKCLQEALLYMQASKSPM